MSRIPSITKSTESSSISKHHQKITDRRKEAVDEKIAGIKSASSERKGQDVAFSISDNPTLDIKEAPTFKEQSIEIIQFAYSGLKTVEKILLELLEVTKLLKSHDLSPSMRKEMKTKMTQLLDEIDYIALNTKSNNVKVLGNITGETIKLSVAPVEEREVLFQPYHVTTEELGIRHLVQRLREDNILEKLTFAIEKSIANVGLYQSELIGISKELGIEENMQLEKYNPFFVSDEAREMSELTRLLILSAYGITFFSQMAKKIQKTLQTSYGIIVIVLIIIIIMLVTI